jgi:hypothetical protein
MACGCDRAVSAPATRPLVGTKYGGVYLAARLLGCDGRDSTTKSANRRRLMKAAVTNAMLCANRNSVPDRPLPSSHNGAIRLPLCVMLTSLSSSMPAPVVSPKLAGGSARLRTRGQACPCVRVLGIALGG